MTPSHVWVVSQDSEHDGNSGVRVFATKEGVAASINEHIRTYNEDCVEDDVLLSLPLVTADQISDMESFVVGSYTYLVDLQPIEP